MADREWRVRCPHCGHTTVLGEDQLDEGFTRATAALMAGEIRRADIDNYPIPCPACGRFMPFEPRSEYRRRKVEALRQRGVEVDAAIGAQDEKIRLLTWPAAKMLVDMLETDYPLEAVREDMPGLRTRLQSAFETFGAADHRVVALMEDMIAIAESDIGERTDLPPAPPDPVTALLDTMMTAIPNAAAKTPTPAEPPAPETPKSTCFIATAAWGTPQHADVMALCAFRERVLRPSAAGRRVIAFYERRSPPIAARLARSPRARVLVRHLLIAPARRAADACVHAWDHGLRPLRQLRPPR